MLRIDDLGFGVMPNDEQYTFHCEFRDIVGKYGDVAKIVDDDLVEHGKCLTDLETEGVEKDDFDDRLRLKNRERFEIYKGLAGLAEIFYGDFDLVRRFGAKEIKKTIERFGDLRSVSYDDKTKKINDLVDAFRDPKKELRKILESLGLDRWVRELKYRNELYEALVWGVERFSKKEEKDKRDRQRRLRRSASKLYWSILDTIGKLEGKGRIGGLNDFADENDRWIRPYIEEVEKRIERFEGGLF